MKIVHITISGAYTDNLTYQENYLIKYHKKMGLDVYLIASEWMYDENGQYAKKNNSHYIDDNGVNIIRLKMRGKDDITKKIRKYQGLYEELDKIQPDIIFHHGCQSVEEKTVVKYCKKHRNVTLYVDNHSDFSNSASNWISKNIQHKMMWRFYAKMIEPYVKKFYGVLPARVDFLNEMYGIPSEKIELLPLGADDELVQSSNHTSVRNAIREQYNIGNSEFLVITGGKIDMYKQQTLLLMDAINKIPNTDIKLIVFGSVVDQLKEEVKKRCTDKVQYIGWVQALDSYKYFAAADLVVFPGRHSVFWEQVAGQGIPMVVKYWDGTTHVDRGGNVRFLRNDSSDEIVKVITECRDNYPHMKEIAQKSSEYFRYDYIAKKSIGY